MRPEDRDAAYLWDMREAALSIVRFVQSSTIETFAADDLLPAEPA